MDYIKVSFIGDIMCEKPFLYSAHMGGNRYDFDRAFAELAGIFKKSDYVIGNLETVCAGKEKNYTHELYSFNSPDSFICALKKCGIDFVSTANNHCLDRGIDGMKRTLDVLDANGIGHTGTYRTKQESNEPCIVDINGLKLGLVAFTYGTNPNMNGVLFSKEEQYFVNLLQAQEYKKDTTLFGKLKGLVTDETKTKIKKISGRPYKNITIDDIPKEFDETYLVRLAESINRVKRISDYTVCLLHCGGQFNREPGEYSKYMMDFLTKHGVDSIIGNHPHIVQTSQMMTNGISTYCLGNVSISPSSIYVPMENKPDYSVVVHMYFRKEGKKLEKITASVLKIVEESNHYLKVYPVWDLCKELDGSKKEKIVSDTKMILQTFAGRKISDFKMQEEWNIPV